MVVRDLHAISCGLHLAGSAIVVGAAARRPVGLLGDDYAGGVLARSACDTMGTMLGIAPPSAVEGLTSGPGATWVAVGDGNDEDGVLSAATTEAGPGHGPRRGGVRPPAPCTRHAA